MKLSKKGMGIGQVFIFIVAAITFALIMIFGYNAINSFLESGENVEFVQFKTSLENSLKRIYTEYGAIRIQQFSIPVRYEKICFVDLDYKPSDQEIQRLCKIDPLACDTWRTAISENGYQSAEQNVFLSPRQDRQVVIKINPITISDAQDEDIKLGFLCPEVKGGLFSVVLEGKGDHTEISAIK
jgi:hypothetical protein